ncbi:hypothetical protein FRC01_002991 [Tulasnella sp. 417]|nr:hypothetical protein FRC01_002991 [Tulasnella sp. 417]
MADEDEDLEDNEGYDAEVLPALGVKQQPKRKRAMLGRMQSVTQVAEWIKRLFFVPESKPEYIFYDNNCNLAKHVKHDPWWDDIGLPVDVFHFKCKHKESDLFCQSYCNPALFPELMDGDEWRFNSSIAEQTNVWFGGYHSICREMQVDRFNFFLDEMIMRKNRLLIAKLKADGAQPSYAVY